MLSLKKSWPIIFTGWTFLALAGPILTAAVAALWPTFAPLVRVALIILLIWAFYLAAWLATGSRECEYRGQFGSCLLLNLFSLAAIIFCILLLFRIEVWSNSLIAAMKVVGNHLLTMPDMGRLYN